MHVTGNYTVKSWDEGAFAEVNDAPKLTHAEIVYAYTGGLAGEGTAQLVMAYRPDASAEYAGYERIVGTLDGREGSFVVHEVGTFENGVASTKWQVVDGSATGALAGLTGEGGYDARSGASAYAYWLDYTLPG